jgi:hypothetical protein
MLSLNKEDSELITSRDIDDYTDDTQSYHHLEIKEKKKKYFISFALLFIFCFLCCIFLLIVIFLIYFIISYIIFNEIFIAGERSNCNYNNNPSTYTRNLPECLKNITSERIFVPKENWKEVNFLSKDPFWIEKGFIFLIKVAVIYLHSIFIMIIQNQL